MTSDGIKSRHQILQTLDDIYATIAVTLGKETLTRSKPEEQAEIIKALFHRPIVFIVDNLETVDDETVISFLMELPAPTKAIVTTRHRIDLAYPVRLLGMPEEDAVRLATNESEAKNERLSQEQIAQLVRRTGGIPLAIVWSIAQIISGYDISYVSGKSGILKGDLARFCFEGVIETIKTKPSFELLLSLSTFEAGASRESLGVVADLPEYDRDEGLVLLEKLSLVNKNAGRFTMLPLTKEYTYAILSEDEQELNIIEHHMSALVLVAVREVEEEPGPRRDREGRPAIVRHEQERGLRGLDAGERAHGRRRAEQRRRRAERDGREEVDAVALGEHEIVNERELVEPRERRLRHRSVLADAVVRELVRRSEQRPEVHKLARVDVTLRMRGERELRREDPTDERRAIAETALVVVAAACLERVGSSQCGSPPSQSASSLPPCSTTLVFAAFLNRSRSRLRRSPPGKFVPKLR